MKNDRVPSLFFSSLKFFFNCLFGKMSTGTQTMCNEDEENQEAIRDFSYIFKTMAKIAKKYNKDKREERKAHVQLLGRLRSVLHIRR